MPRTGAVVGVSLDDGSEVVRHVLAAPDADSLPVLQRPGDRRLRRHRLGDGVDRGHHLSDRRR
jgi:hypothetical protein